MTADHAGQTGGERDPHWIKDQFELDGDDGGEREEACCPAQPWGHRPYCTSRPVPVAGQAAREAAVRVLREWSHEHGQWGGPRRTAEQVADELAALSAAPGQVCDRYETEPDPAGGHPADVHSAVPGQEQGLVDWLLSLDQDPDERRTVTLQQIIDRARQEQGR